VLVSEDLKLNVSRLLNVLFHDHMLIIEALLGLSLGSVKLIKELLLIVYDTHSLAASS
jgi:hypothetical protein